MLLHTLPSPQVPVPTPAAAGLVGQGAGCLGVCQDDAGRGAAAPNPGPQASHSYVPELSPALTFRLEEDSHL